MRKMILFLIFLSGLCLVFQFFGCTSNREKDITPIDTSALSRPKDYVGSKRCGECHDRIYKTWTGTKHPYKITETDKKTVVGDFTQNNTLELKDKRDGNKKIVAKMFKQDGKYYVSTFADTNKMQEHEIIYNIGGVWKQRYLTKFPNGALQILPVQWNVKTREWVDYHGLKGHTPGDGKYWSDSSRTWQKNCAKCHTTGFKENFKDNKYTSTWADNGAGCEACHGPGSHHVNIDVPEKADTIFNAAYLHDDRRANMLCGRCHTRGKSTDGKYGYPDTYEVGDELTFHYREISAGDKKRFWPDGSSKSHHQQFIDFQKSVMYAKGVKCWACHDPHKASAGNSASLRLSGNILCQSCHGKNAGNGGNLTHSIHDTGNCFSCHLPKTAKSAISGDISAHTFFAIPPTATQKFADGNVKKQPNSCSLCHYHKNTPVSDLVKAYEKKHNDYETFKSASLTIND